MRFSFVVISLFLIVITCNAGNIKSLELVKEGVGKTEIVISAKADKKEKYASSILVKYIAESTGAKISIVPEDKLGGAPIRIYLGSTNMASKYQGKLSKMLPDGYIIAFPEQNIIVIAGASDKGLDFAVFDFLERYVGVRWLMPGAMGEYVPEKTSILVPIKEIIEEPAFVSRRISHNKLWGNWEGPGKNDLQKWAYHMRYNSRVEFHHNLRRLFPSSRYGKSNPDFFPVLKGKRYIPPPKNRGTTSQLCFTNDNSVSEAVKRITQKFTRSKTNNYTYSLGINDVGGHGYCQCKTCVNRHKKGKNFIGFENYSDLYYPWVNKIASSVAEKYPTVKIGLLAYYNVIEPPEDRQLDSHVVPYICYETLSFINPVVKNKNKELLDKWSRTKCQIGWYDYAYGRQYILPRVYPHYLTQAYTHIS